MLEIKRPKYVQNKQVAEGVGWYWVPPTYWKKRAKLENRPFPFTSVPLGINLGQAELDATAKPHNLTFEQWKAGGYQKSAAYGTVRWLLLDQYVKHDAFTRKVSERSRADYTLLYERICSIATKDGRTFGDLPVLSITPAAANKIYNKMIEGEKFRRGEKAIMYLGTAWRRMQPHFPREFRDDVPNPWDGVTMIKRRKKIKAAVTREQVYTFARKAIEMKRFEAATAAVVCFEWLQRPESVIGGHIRWTDYRAKDNPIVIRIEHYKTGQMVLHPLEETDEDGFVTLFYADAESVLQKLPRRGLRMILGPEAQTYKPSRFAQIVRRIADEAGLPKTFTLDACRHGGMTELEEAELTDGQGRALSAHRSRAYDGYAKRTQVRLLKATKRRSEHVNRNKNDTDFRMVNGSSSE